MKIENKTFLLYRQYNLTFTRKNVLNSKIKQNRQKYKIRQNNTNKRSWNIFLLFHKKQNYKIGDEKYEL